MLLEAVSYKASDTKYVDIWDYPGSVMNFLAACSSRMNIKLQDQIGLKQVCVWNRLGVLAKPGSVTLALLWISNVEREVMDQY